MQEPDEERTRYRREPFAELPIALRQAIEHHLYYITSARRGDVQYRLHIENVTFEFNVENIGRREAFGLSGYVHVLPPDEGENPSGSR